MINSSQEFISLRISDNQKDYKRTIDEEVKSEVWIDLIGNYPDMREWVALNKRVPLKILEILSDDPNPKVRFTVALKRKLTFDLFEKLSRDSDESVRFCIAQNKKVPRSVLETLVNDSKSIVRNEAKKRLIEMD